MVRKLSENTYSLAEIFIFILIVWNTLVHRTVWKTNEDRNSMDFRKKWQFFCFEKSYV